MYPLMVFVEMILYPADKINFNVAGQSTSCHTVWEPVTYNMLMLIILSPRR